MRLLDRHDRYSATTLNLIPSLNVPSQAIYRAMHSDLLNRVAEGWVGERSFPGMKFYEMIEQIGITSAKRLFRYEHVDLRPISGTLANAAVFGAFTKSGDTIVTLGLQQGAHNSMATDLPCKVFGLRVECLPFDRDSLNIDVIRAIKLLRSASPAPKLVMLGGSVLLYPQPLRPIVKAAHEFGAIVVYDGSHVAGLIAGGEFQDPYEDNIDVVTMATCKTMPGPQGAMILSRPEFSDRLKHVISPTLHSGHHLHETVGKVLALLELEAFGAKYAQKVISNAQRLGDELSSRNLPVYSRRGGPTTLSHTLLVDCTRWGGGIAAERILESGGILVNRVSLPAGQGEPVRSGIRIGTQEMTRFGMKREDMSAIASFISRSLDGGDPRQIRREVKAFRSQFQAVDYCFPDPSPIFRAANCRDSTIHGRRDPRQASRMGHKLHICRGTDADVPLLGKIEESVYEYAWSTAEFEDRLRKPGAGFLLATKGSAAVGFVVFRTGKRTEIINLAVLGKYRGAGVGIGLLSKVISDLALPPDHRLYLYCRAGNKEAIDFYKKVGFRVIRRKKGHWKNNGEEGLLMAAQVRNLRTSAESSSS
jgi:glycine hydroxymethyltransferase